MPYFLQSHGVNEYRFSNWNEAWSRDLWHMSNLFSSTHLNRTICYVCLLGSNDSTWEFVQVVQQFLGQMNFVLQILQQFLSQHISAEYFLSVKEVYLSSFHKRPAVFTSLWWFETD